MEQVLITILIYSTLLTILFIYKDFSNYSVENSYADLILAGPVCWVLVVLVNLLHVFKPVREFFDKFLKRDPKDFTVKKAERIVYFITLIAKRDKWRPDAWFNIDTDYEFKQDYFCWNDLMVKKFPYEMLNKRFNRLMRKQHHLGKAALLKYMTPITKDDYKDCNKWWIEEFERGKYGVLYKFK